jgi:peroxiredoxin
MYEDLDKEKFEIISINITAADSIDEAKKTAEEHGLKYYVLSDASGSVATDYKVRGVPTNIIIRPDGLITEYTPGMLDSEYIIEALGLAYDAVEQ